MARSECRRQSDADYRRRSGEEGVRSAWSAILRN
jgi:hypothetical protein